MGNGTLVTMDPRKPAARLSASILLTLLTVSASLATLPPATAGTSLLAPSLPEVATAPAPAGSTPASTAPAVPDLGILPASSLQAAGLSWQPWMSDVHAQLRALPGFLGLLPPTPDGAPTLRALFSGAAPLSLPAVPSPWTLEPVPHAAAQRLMQRLPDNVRMEPTPAAAPTHQSLLPPLAWSDGISPGAQIYMDFAGTGSPQFICSSNFVWKDQNGNLYLGAAGHCFLPPGSTATVNAGPDGDVGPGEPDGKDSDNFNFWACWEDCLFGGQTGALLMDFVIQGAVKLGPIAYARQTEAGQDVGRDFGIITIPTNLYADVEPSIPVWGGPVGVNPASVLGDIVLIHGNAAYDGEVFATKSRAGLSLGANTIGGFAALLKSSGGDSGSAITTVNPVTDGTLPLVNSPEAMGILTHGIQVPNVGYGLGLMQGTTYPQARIMAKQAGLCIEALEEGEDPENVVPAAAEPGCPVDVPPGAPKVTITTPSDGDSFTVGDVTVAGHVNRLSSDTAPLSNATITAGDGVIGQAIPIAGTATGGTLPYQCAWSASGGSFGNSAACSTTVSFATAGTKTLSLSVTDSAPTPATVSTTLDVTISSQPAPVCVDDSDVDALEPTGIYELTRACGQAILADGELKVDVDIFSLDLENLVGNAASPAIYTVSVQGVANGWDVYHDLGNWDVWNNNANAASAGSASSTDTTLTIHIPFSEMSAAAGYVPGAFRVASGVGVGIVSTPFATVDSVPDGGYAGPLVPAGSAILFPSGTPASTAAPLPPPASVPPTPELTDPNGDVTAAGLPVDHEDIEAAWFRSDADYVYVGLKVKSIPDPAVTSQVAYTIGFRPSWAATWPIPGADTFDGLRVVALWSRVQVDALGPPPSVSVPASTVFELQALSHAGPTSHFSEVATLPQSSLSAATGIFWFVVPRSTLQVPAAGGSLDTLTASTVPAVGGVVTFGSAFGDSATSTASVTIPPLFGASITAPATAAVGVATAIHGVGVSGTPPYSCTWSGAGATFANAGPSSAACDTTVTFSTLGAKTISLSLTDSAATPATATAAANITVVNAERVEVYDGSTKVATAVVTTSLSSPTATWTTTASLAGAGAHTLVAKWIDSDGTVLDTDAVDITLTSAAQPYVTITDPATDGEVRDAPAIFGGNYSTDGSPSGGAGGGSGTAAFDPGVADLLHGPAYQNAVASLRSLPGFLSAIPVQDAATPTLTVVLSGAVPEHAPMSAAGWALQYVGEVAAQPMTGRVGTPVEAVSVDEALAQLRSRQSAPDGPYLPGTDAANGIGPGSAIYFPVGGGLTGLCSASFLLRDPATLKYYLSTAGHCLLKTEEGPATSGYETPEAVWPEIYVCFQDCIENWNLFLGHVGTYVAFKASPDNSYNPVAFAQAQGIGSDFGLIEIPAEAEALLRPYMPVWGGPTGYEAPAVGDLLAHFGQGAYCCTGLGAAATRLPTDQARLALSLGNDGSSFDALGDLSGGDSGSATSTVALRADKTLLGDGAVGVNTHGVVVDHLALFWGTLLRHGVADMAAAKGFGGLDLVDEDGALVDLGGGSGPSGPHADFTAPDDGSSVAQGTSVAIAGTATFPPANPELTYYLHRDGCGTASDNPHMTTTPSLVAEGGDGCGSLDGPLQILLEMTPLAFLLPNFEDYPAVPAPAAAIGLDAARDVEVQLFFSGFVGEPLQVIHDLEGRIYSGTTLVASGRVTEVLPATGEVNLALDITGPATLPAGASLTFRLIQHESLGPMFVEYGGAHLSQVRLPLAASPALSVEVSVDDPAFGASSLLAVTGTTSWSATWSVGASTPTGSHTLYARAIQGTLVQSPASQLQLTVTGAAPPEAAFDWVAHGLSVDFTDTSTAGAAAITGWAWDFGDGATSTAQSPTHTYAAEGAYTVTLTVTDANGNSDAASRAVAVVSPAVWEVQARILDPQGDQSLGWTTVATPAANEAGTWSLSWSPAATPASGDYTLEARLLKDDVPVASDDRTFVVPNHAPALTVPGSQSTAEGQNVAFSVLASDPDTSDTVTLSVSDLPAGASFDAETGAFDWTPGYDQAGAYTVTFTAGDGNGGSDTESVSIQVDNTNRAPVLDPIADVVSKARDPIVFTVQATDPDGQTVAYSADNLPTGAAFDSATGAFSWTPTRRQVGIHTVTFHASDGDLEDSQDVHFTITRH